MLLQVPIEVDFNNVNPEQFQDVQNVDWQALADLSTNPATQEAAGQLAWLAGGMMAFVAIIALFAIILTIINLFNVWHWGTTDNAIYEAGGQTKKKWFIIFFILPMIVGLVAIIPILGWIAAPIIYIYWVVMVFVYFFGVRKKIGASSSMSNSSPSTENKKV